VSDSPGNLEPTRPRRSVIRESALMGVLLIALAVTLAACGGGTPTSAPSTSSGAASSGSNSSGTSNSSVQQALKYAQCMRSHGVTNYADPSPGKSQSIGQSGIDTNSPTYQAAASACRSYQPTNTDQGPTAQDQSQQLQFAQCMRSHGVPNFPEGNNGGGQQSVTQYGIDPNSPTFQAANSACSSLLSGSGG
jgi:hypothetical protein